MTWATNHIFCHFHFCEHFHCARKQISEIHVDNSIFRFPFDWMTPFGYLAALTVEGIVCISMPLMGAPSFCLLIGACILLSAFAKSIANDVVNFNADFVALNQSNGALKSRFRTILQKFADAKQLSWKLPNALLQSFYKCFENFFNSFRLVDMVNDFCEFIVFATFIWTLTTIASCLLIFELVEHLNAINAKPMQLD